MIWSIRDRGAFERLASSGCRSRTRTLWCRYLNEPAARPLRVAFAVGRSYGPAVQRNRLRRQLRVIIDRAAAEGALTAGWLLVGANSSAQEHTFDELRHEIDDLLGRLPRPEAPAC